MTTTCRTFQTNEAGRDFVVGDVHGCFRTLERALEAVAFDAERDRLFGVGSLVARGPHSGEALDWLEHRFTGVTRGSREHVAMRWLADNLGGSTPAPRGWLRSIEPATYRHWHDAFARMPLAITVETRHCPVGIVHAESPHESWDRATEMLERGDGVDVALLGCANGGLDAREYRGRHVDGLRALVHGQERVSEPEWAANRFNINTGAGYLHLDQPTVAQIDVERVKTTTVDVIDW